MGDEESPTVLSTISDEAWWSTKVSERKVISKTFPASGHIIEPGLLNFRGAGAFFESSSQRDASEVFFVTFGSSVISSFYGMPGDYAYPVRLFTRRSP